MSAINEAQGYTYNKYGYRVVSTKLQDVNLFGINGGNSLVTVATGVLGALTIFDNIAQRTSWQASQSGGNTGSGGLLDKRSSEELQGEIDSIYEHYGVTDAAGLEGKASEAKNAQETATSTKNEAETAVTTAENNLKTAKEALASAKQNLRGAKADDPNYANLQATLSKWEGEVKAKEAELNKAEGALKQAKAEEEAKKAEYDAIVQSQEEIKRLNDKLEKAKVREAREKKEAEEAEEKRKREETIESLSNGDTAAISKLLKQIRNADSLG